MIILIVKEFMYPLKINYKPLTPHYSWNLHPNKNTVSPNLGVPIYKKPTVFD